MKELYLHIGQPKTGTSALQRFFKLNKEILQKKGICYPLLNGEDENVDMHSNQSAGNCPFFIRLEKEIEQLEQEELLYVSKLKDIFEKQDKVLISSEHLWWISMPKFILNMQKLLEGGYDELQVKVIIFLRRQDERHEAEWNQNVKSGRLSLTFEEFSQNSIELFKCGKRLDDIAATLGKRNMFVKIYDQKNFPLKGIPFLRIL